METGQQRLNKLKKFSGILVPLFKKMLDENTFNGFNLMNKKLKD